MFQCVLAFNGENIGPGGEIAVSPGLPHAMTVRIDSSEAACAGFRAVVKKTLPGGAVDRQEGDMAAGEERGFDLGPLTAPPQYVHEAGDVYRVGYRIEVAVKDKHTGAVRLHRQWSQALSTEARPWRIAPRATAQPISAGLERFVAGGARRVLHNPKRAVEVALALRLDEGVLTDQDDVRALFRINGGSLVEGLACRLRVWDGERALPVDKAVTVVRGEGWQGCPVEAGSWPAGDYRVALHPEMGGRVWPEGPEVVYRRREPEAGSIAISPLAPWTLRRDPAREEATIHDLREAFPESSRGLPRGWAFEETEKGAALVAEPGGAVEPLELRPPAQGLCAVFATPHGHGCVIQAGDDGLARPLAGPLTESENNGAVFSGRHKEVFVAIADVSRAPIRLFGFGGQDEAVAGLAGLRLAPVEADSAEAFRTAAAHPPSPLFGVNDWGCFFAEGRSLPPRMEPDQFDAIVAGQAELGLKTIDWSVGRSGVSYESKLPGVPRIFRGPSGVDPLAEVFRCGERYGSEVWGWYAMMYYGQSKKAGDRSRMFMRYPQFRRWLKNADCPDSGEQGGQLLSFYFPEIRRDKVDVLVEVAERGVAGVLVGTGRLAPVMDYHPKLVAEFKRRHGIDPLKIDATRKEEYRLWIGWRADFFTQMLRELRSGLVPIEQEQSRRVRVGVRLPSSGLFFNLAQGLDVERWLSEGLVDLLQLDPVEDRCGSECHTHDVRPYLELARSSGTPVVGGLGATWMRAPEALPAALRRALGLLEAGVDGVELYESDLLGRSSDYRWAAPLFGDAERLRNFLDDSNLEACHPLTARTCMYGYDNHSRWLVEAPAWIWDVYGFGPNSL